MRLVQVRARGWLIKNEFSRLVLLVQIVQLFVVLLRLDCAPLHSRTGRRASLVVLDVLDELFGGAPLHLPIEHVVV